MKRKLLELPFNGVVDFKGLLCQEASIHSKATYIPCARPALAAVWHERDKRLYLMCLGCADHNVRNRGGKLVASGDAGVLASLMTDKVRRQP